MLLSIYGGFALLSWLWSRVEAGVVPSSKVGLEHNLQDLNLLPGSVATSSILQGANIVSNASSVGAVGPSDIGVTASVETRGRALPEDHMTIFNILAMVDLFRRTLQNRGDGPIEGGECRLDYIDLGMVITTTRGPTRHWRMTYADAFYGLTWVFLFMNDLRPEWHPTFWGFWENTYDVVRKNVQPWRQIGQIQIAFHEANPRPPEASLASASPEPVGPVNFAAFEDLELSNGTSPSIQTVTTLPNPFQVPDSDVTLIFRRPIGEAPTRKAILGVIFAFFLDSYQSVIAKRADAPFKQENIVLPEIAVYFVPRMRDGRPLTTDSIMVDALLGMVIYMSTEGFTATDVTIVKPDAAGKRSPVGTFKIRAGAGLRNANNGTRTADAGSGTDISVS